jgi:hypothetical protein
MTIDRLQRQALFSLYPNISVLRDDVAYDADGNEVAYDKDAVQAYVDAHAYIAKRASEYPSITDYIDGVVKGDQAQIQAYIDACLAVKARHPKGVK